MWFKYGLISSFLQEEKEQLIEYRSTVASLVGRAKTLVQLRPRSAESNLAATTPIRAICDYRQIEVREAVCYMSVFPSSANRDKALSGDEERLRRPGQSVCTSIQPQPTSDLTSLVLNPHHQQPPLCPAPPLPTTTLWRLHFITSLQAQMKTSTGLLPSV